MSLPVVLIVDHESEARDILEAGFNAKARVLRADSIVEAEELLQAHTVSVLICRDDLPGETGIMFLARYNGVHPWERRILLCPELDSELAVFLINEAQVFRCVTFPLEPAILIQSVEVALQESQRIQVLFNLGNENEQLRQRLTTATNPGFKATQVSQSWVRAFPRMVVIILLTFAGVLVLGTVTLLLLYVLKSLLGIDLIPGGHLKEVLG